MGRNGYNGFGFGKGAPHCDDHTMAELWISAQAAHLRYCHLLREQAAHSISLSKREKQVLEKILRGRNGVYDIEVTNQDGAVIAYFRGKSRQIKGQIVPGLTADE
jgi:nitrogen fixation protein FixH